MYIAEVAGLPKEQLMDAYNFLESYEENNNIAKRYKNSKYLPASVLNEYRRLLCIKQITRIIKEQKQADLNSITFLASNLKPEKGE